MMNKVPKLNKNKYKIFVINILKEHYILHSAYTHLVYSYFRYIDNNNENLKFYFLYIFLNIQFKAYNMYLYLNHWAVYKRFCRSNNFIR